MQLQLRRPSDGAVSESRPFEFIPLDAGRAYWSAKRLKTNYSVFNQILSMDQASRQGEAAVADLKHKAPLSRAPVMAGVFSGGEGEDGPPRQQLRPVAMPGGYTPMAATTNLLAPAAEAQGPPPQVPNRSPLRSSLLTGVYDPLPQQRPISELSLMSDFSTMTGGDNISVTTRQSVNEILSLAEGSVYSEDTINLDSISVNSMLNVPGTGMCEVKEEPLDTPGPGHRESLRQPMGSLTSVATVKENILVDQAHLVQPLEEPSSTSNMPMDITEDLGQIYDDVMQCVYDDVDVKYDDLDLADAPVPPPRLRQGSVDLGGVEKPLPGVPRNKIISRLEEKKNEIIQQREKEAEKKKQADEQKRKEKEALEEQKRLEREEREKKKQEEKEKKRLEEEHKKTLKRKEDEEKKAKKAAEMEDEAKLKQSLFQRLFQRSQSRTEGQEDVDITAPGLEGDAPPVPPHAPGLACQLTEVEGQLGDLEQLMEGGVGPGDLQRLDSLVTEFTSQFPPEPSESVVKS